MKTGNTRLKTGPARIIRVRCQTGFAEKVRGTSAGGIVSVGSSPAIFTYPPSGNQETQYSVSLRRKLRKGIFGPKPKENFSTLTLKSLASRKWPNS